MWETHRNEVEDELKILLRIENLDCKDLVSGLGRGRVRKLVPDPDPDHHPDPTYLGRVLLRVSRGLGQVLVYVLSNIN